MDLGRLIRFITGREIRVEDVKAYVATLRRRGEDGVVAIGRGELGERERVLLSIAERAGAVELEPGGRDGLLVALTGRGSPRQAYGAIKAAKDRGWESYRSIERFITGAERCRRRQILDHFGDEEEGMASGRCCDVCDPDAALEQAVRATTAVGGGVRDRAGREPALGSARPRPGSLTAPRRHGGRKAGAVAGGPAAGEQAREPVDEEWFERLRAWRWERAEGKPAFTVAANAVLEEVLRRRPQSLEALIEIRGIGPAFCEKHGASLLAALDGLRDGSARQAQDGAARRAGRRPSSQLDAALASGRAPT
jgi:ATP-dependent DNA helicase RecQ